MRFSRIALTLAAASMTALPALTQTDFTYKEYAPQGAASITAPNAHSADFNGDGLADVLSPQVVYNCVNGTCTAQYFIYLYLNSSSGLQSPQKLAVTLTDQPAGIAISDFNGDNKLDIAVLSPSGVISVLYGNGNGTFAAPVNVTLPAGNYSSLVEADFDVNGTQDLAALNQNGSLALLFNDGKGNFTQQPVQVDTPASGYTANSLVVGDFNADGRPDIAWVEEGNITSQDNTVYSALNTAKGVFSTRHEVGTELPGFSGLLSADLDLDGKSDLITWSTQLSENCCQDEPVMTYFSNGDGTFAGSQLASTITYGLGVTDINGDGNPDVLISSEAGFTIYTGSGNRTFSDGGTNTMLHGSGGTWFLSKHKPDGIRVAERRPDGPQLRRIYLYVVQRQSAGRLRVSGERRGDVLQGHADRQHRTGARHGARADGAGAGDSTVGQWQDAVSGMVGRVQRHADTAGRHDDYGGGSRIQRDNEERHDEHIDQQYMRSAELGGGARLLANRG
jgi:hypothetical protein